MHSFAHGQIPDWRTEGVYPQKAALAWYKNDQTEEGGKAQSKRH